MKKTLLFASLAVLWLPAVGWAQNRILDSGNQFFSITNFGPNNATMSNLTGLPLGTVPEASGTGELALKVMVVGGGGGGGGGSVIVTGTQRTATITTVSSSGSVAAGARKLTFIFSGDYTGTVLSGTFAGATDSSINIEAPTQDTLSAVGYTVGAGSIRIIKVQ